MFNRVLFFFNDTATTEIYTLSLHDALPICHDPGGHAMPDDVGMERVADQPQAHAPEDGVEGIPGERQAVPAQDRKSTRLNSSHANISYAVFCLKKKKTQQLNFSHNYTCKNK